MIDRLFEEGKRAKRFPLSVTFLPLEGGDNHQAGFAVSKRNFKNAVDRNRIKRQLREAYRLNQHLLAPKNGTKFALLFVFLAKESLDFHQINEAMVKLLKGKDYEDY